MTPLLAQRPRADRQFERLYQRHVGDVYRYALAVLRNPQDAEDVTQTTFMNAYRAFARGERPKTAHNWLIAIAHNVCRQRFRQTARRPNEVQFEEELAESFTPDEDGPSAEDIRRALGHLAFNQRAALVMRELEGRSYAEIAEILDLSVAAVETLIFRARRALREQLEESLTCGEAELAVSKQLDGRLPREERGRLRAHIRECEECAKFARSQRAQSSSLSKALTAVPLPASLGSFFGKGGATVAGGLAAKAALVGTAALVAGSVGYEGVHHRMWQKVVPAKKHAAVAKKQSQRLVNRAAPAHATATPAVPATPAIPGVSRAVPAKPAVAPPGPREEHANPVKGARPSKPVPVRADKPKKAKKVKPVAVKPPKARERVKAKGPKPPPVKAHLKKKPPPPPPPKEKKQGPGEEQPAPPASDEHGQSAEHANGNSKN